MDQALQQLIGELDSESSLLEPQRLRQRLDALDILDVHFPDPSATTALHQRARAIYEKLEAVNEDLYAAIRREIQSDANPEALLRWVPVMEAESAPASGMGYDHLDELVSGVFQFQEPAAQLAPIEPEMVFYQPTPARHIFHLLGLTQLTAHDILIDLGSGLGHVPLLTTVCTPARSIGIELEPAYVASAQQCAHQLNLKNVTFQQQDARAADLSTGTVFYLHTPFKGSIMKTVLEHLKHQAATRPLRICTYGPCTPLIAEEPWLKPAATPKANQIVVFSSRP